MAPLRNPRSSMPHPRQGKARANMQGCGTCRIRKKKCPGPSHGTSGGCKKCRELGIECLERYREPVPQKYRTAAVTKALARWYRSRGSRHSSDFLWLSDIVDVKTESPSLSHLMLSSTSPSPARSSPAIAHSSHSSPPSSSFSSPSHKPPAFAHPVSFQHSLPPVIPYLDFDPNYNHWMDNTYPVLSQYPSYQRTEELYQSYAPAESSWWGPNGYHVNVSSARLSPFSVASSAASPSISDGPSFVSGPHYDPPYDDAACSFYNFGPPL